MDGYLVVLKHHSNDAPWIPGYRGIDRLIPYSVDAARRGFIDPLVFGSVTDEAGLIKTLDDAEQVAEVFSKTTLPDNIEIIGVREVLPERTLPAIPCGWRLLGFDIAGTSSPFYSLVGDFPGDGALDWYRDQLNVSRLFADPATAFRYLSDYQLMQLADYDLPYTCWAVLTRD